VYEPRVEGHHPGWLRFVTEDLLSGGWELTLAVDLRPESRVILEDSLRDLISRVRLVPALEADGRRRGGGTLRSLLLCLGESGASRAFLCEFDELASAIFRSAAWGRLPPELLRGRVGGIYHRPRFMAAPRWSPNRWLKQRGFRRLVANNWLNPLLFIDEDLLRERQDEFPGAPLGFLPNPCPSIYEGDRTAACLELGVPPERRVFLFYGSGYRRKGLHLAVAAFLDLTPADNGFLLCVGRQNPDAATARGLERLLRENRARLINRYVSTAEERSSFVACDVVLLPYVNHFGISGVLAQAAAAGKPVIASDEQLLGRETREYRLGLLFPSGDVAALRERLREFGRLTEARRAELATAAHNYAVSHSRLAYRAALLKALEAA
jgi:glycosyltransferase involved in cell wall biosynthesis